MAGKTKVLFKRIFFIGLFFTGLLCSLAGCGDKRSKTITSLEQLSEEGIKIGVLVSCPEEKEVSKSFPKADIAVYTDEQLGCIDVINGKLDAFIDSRRMLDNAIAGGLKGVRTLDEAFTYNKVAVGISDVSPIPDLKGKLNTFIAKIKADGTYGEMYDRWVDQGNDTMPEIRLPEEPRVHIRVGTTGLQMPFSYYKGDKITGLDIELAYRFAAWMNADIEFKTYDFGGVIAAAQSGDVDCIMTNLYYTPERAESITYSDFLYELEVTALVRDDGNGAMAEGTSFLEGVRESFEKTFIREDRWKLFIQGIVTTIIITVLSVIFGTVLGFAVYMACRNGNRLANGITKVAVWLVQGMPMVVFLMILYYIIFGNVDIDGTVVATIGFSLVFGSSVYRMIETGVGTVDGGQMEAARALGYNDKQGFFRVVFPQAVPGMFPIYLGEVNGLIKATAIVGYIAVQDLTRMGDLVRSRTYDAFFPLIAVAVVYFILAALLTAVIKRIGRLVR